METEKRFMCTYSRQENKDITKEYEKTKKCLKHSSYIAQVYTHCEDSMYI